MELCVNEKTCQTCPKRETCLALHPHPTDPEYIEQQTEALYTEDEYGNPCYGCGRPSCLSCEFNK